MNFVSGKAYSASNWTVPTLPSTSRGPSSDPSNRRLRSTTFSDDLYPSKPRIRRLGPRKYLCTDCGSTFALQASLARHQSMECTRELVKTVKSPKAQMKIKTVNILRPAPKLSTMVPSVRVILPHPMLIPITQIKPDPDAIDGAAAESAREKKKKHTCKKCGKVYAFYTSLWRHLHYECGMEPQFTCEICNLRFAQKSNLERHMRNMHPMANMTLP